MRGLWVFLFAVVVLGALVALTVSGPEAVEPARPWEPGAPATTTRAKPRFYGDASVFLSGSGRALDYYGWLWSRLQPVRAGDIYWYLEHVVWAARLEPEPVPTLGYTGELFYGRYLAILDAGAGDVALPGEDDVVLAGSIDAPCGIRVDILVWQDPVEPRRLWQVAYAGVENATEYAWCLAYWLTVMEGYGYAPYHYLALAAGANPGFWTATFYEHATLLGNAFNGYRGPLQAGVMLERYEASTVKFRGPDGATYRVESLAVLEIPVLGVPGEPYEDLAEFYKEEYNVTVTPRRWKSHPAPEAEFFALVVYPIVSYLEQGKAVFWTGDHEIDPVYGHRGYAGAASYADSVMGRFINPNLHLGKDLFDAWYAYNSFTSVKLGRPVCANTARTAAMLASVLGNVPTIIVDTREKLNHEVSGIWFPSSIVPDPLSWPDWILEERLHYYNMSHWIPWPRERWREFAYYTHPALVLDRIAADFDGDGAEDWMREISDTLGAYGYEVYNDTWRDVLVAAGGYAIAYNGIGPRYFDPVYHFSLDPVIYAYWLLLPEQMRLPWLEYTMNMTNGIVIGIVDHVANKTLIADWPTYWAYRAVDFVYYDYPPFDCYGYMDTIEEMNQTLWYMVEYWLERASKMYPDNETLALYDAYLSLGGTDMRCKLWKPDPVTGAHEVWKPAIWAPVNESIRLMYEALLRAGIPDGYPAVPDPGLPVVLELPDYRGLVEGWLNANPAINMVHELPIYWGNESAQELILELGLVPPSPWDYAEIILSGGAATTPVASPGEEEP